jgi:type VI secretion system secreted protein Hcp
MRHSLAQPIRAVGTLALLVSALSTHAAFDAFLKIEGVPGESTDASHAGWIRVDSLQFGLTGGSALAPTQLAPLTLRKRIDKASPLLAKACATGQHIAQAKLELIRTTPKRTRFYQITLEDVLVTSASSFGVTDDNSLPETIQLAAGQWSWAYTEFELDGRPIQDLESYWDVLRGVGDGSVTPALSASGTQTAAGELTLSFPAKPGVAYRILGAADLTGDLVEVQRLEPGDGGETSITLPAVGPSRFFVVEELP